MLFMSMAYIAAALDASGVFAWLALKITVASGGRGMALFLFYFGLSAFMTTFTSNDVCMWVGRVCDAGMGYVESLTGRHIGEDYS